MLKDEYEGTQFRYDKEMNLQKVTDKIQHPDVIERLVYQDNIALSDMYLLRAVMFFRVCTARMVAERIVYFRTKYGEEECKRLAMPTPDYNILAQKDGIIPDKFVVDVEDRLKKIKKKNVLLHEKYLNSSKGERYELNFFLANSYTFTKCWIRGTSPWSYSIIAVNNFSILILAALLFFFSILSQVIILGIVLFQKYKKSGKLYASRTFCYLFANTLQI